MKLLARKLMSLAFLSAALCAASAVVAEPRPRIVQSVDVQVPFPPTPVVIAGTPHLSYELHVNNFRAVDVALVRLDVQDAGQHNVVATFLDSQLAPMIGTPGSATRPADPRLIRAGMRGVIYLWLPVAPNARMPASLQHRVELDLVQAAARERVVVEGGATVVGKLRPVVLDPPLRGGPWVALYDPAMMGGHRTAIYTVDGRARIPARFAIDWVRLSDDASRARGDVTAIANWHGYGAEVLAVADGTVAAAMDDIVENPSLSGDGPPVTLENASGNFITLNIGNGRYAFYEHLKHGSLRVKVNDRVKRGQVIAQLGNSGSSSSGPHLHFHIADANSHLAAEGLPYVFSNFEVIGAFPEIGTFMTGNRWTPAPNAAGGKRIREHPSANTIVMFR